MTYKEKVLSMFETPNITLSCTQICRKLIVQNDIPLPKRVYLSASISSILNKLVKDEILQYSTIPTKRGGHIYELDRKMQMIRDLREEVNKLKTILASSNYGD